MDKDYIENENKVLDIDEDKIVKLLEKLKAKKCFSGERIVTSFDYQDRRLFKSRSHLKLTEEGSIKISLSSPTIDGSVEEIKFKVSRKKEAIYFLSKLGLMPVAESTSHRISYEYEGVDLDIDRFPQIPTFLEIDLGESKHTLSEILSKLEISNNEVVSVSTPEIYSKFGKNYFTLFEIKK